MLLYPQVKHMHIADISIAQCHADPFLSLYSIVIFIVVEKSVLAITNLFRLDCKAILAHLRYQQSITTTIIIVLLLLLTLQEASIQQCDDMDMHKFG